MAPVLARVAKNLAEESDDDLSYAVANVDAETDFALGLRFLVMQYPTVFAVCGRHVMVCLSHTSLSFLSFLSHFSHVSLVLPRRSRSAARTASWARCTPSVRI